MFCTRITNVLYSDYKRLVLGLQMPCTRITNVLYSEYKQMPFIRYCDITEIMPAATNFHKTDFIFPFFLIFADRRPI